MFTGTLNPSEPGLLPLLLPDAAVPVSVVPKGIPPEPPTLLAGVVVNPPPPPPPVQKFELDDAVPAPEPPEPPAPPVNIAR